MASYVAMATGLLQPTHDHLMAIKPLPAVGRDRAIHLRHQAQLLCNTDVDVHAPARCGISTNGGCAACLHFQALRGSNNQGQSLLLSVGRSRLSSLSGGLTG